MTFSGRWGYSPENVRTKSESCFNIALISLIAPRSAYKEENTVIQADFTVFSGVLQGWVDQIIAPLIAPFIELSHLFGCFSTFFKKPENSRVIFGKALYHTLSHLTTLYHTLSH